MGRGDPRERDPPPPAGRGALGAVWGRVLAGRDAGGRGMDDGDVAYTESH